MILSAANPSSFNPLIIFVILFGVIGIAGLITHIFLRERYEKALLTVAIICALGFTVFLPLWASGVFADIQQSLVLWTFLLGGLTFSCLLIYPYFSKTRIVSRCILTGFVLLAIAFIVCAIFLSKHVLQPNAMAQESSALLPLFL